MVRIINWLLRLVKRRLKIIYRGYVAVLHAVNIWKLQDIPVIVNNYNRLTYPISLIQFLEACGFTNIIILDNNSTYEPLLKYYRNSKFTIVRSSVNHGHLALWKSGLYKRIKWNYFIYSDSDVVPIHECPKDFIDVFKNRLNANTDLEKVGFGIKIDDLPDTFSLKSKVILYEQAYWKKEIDTNIYDAPIDTTFALYKPFCDLIDGHAFTQKANRFGFPFLVRHMPWYVDSANLNDEERQYMETSNDSSSVGEHFKGRKVVY